LDARHVVVLPGIAEVVADFENNILALSVGEQVYVLAEWEIDYYHAWYKGKEVDGGLPIGDSRAFRTLRKPVVESWIKVAGPRGLIRWVPDTEAISDLQAISACEKWGRQ
jgi:hypothetical protein